ncbi:hypothetical protein AURDEDRAFT_24895, partial [Auricularia subglabra TFB-10046 SS5]
AAEVVQLVTAAIRNYDSSAYWSQPYHNSRFTGQDWVNELMNGHPERIRNELGMRLHVFVTLLVELRAMGYGDSQKGVRLEEQLAIFLY